MTKVVFLQVKTFDRFQGRLSCFHLYRREQIQRQINFTLIQFTCRNVDSVVLEMGFKRKWPNYQK